MSLSNPHAQFPTSVAHESFVVAPKSVVTAPSNSSPSFVERRTLPPAPEVAERRQFSSSHTGLTEAGRELAFAIDKYKVENRRRYITCDEMLTVLFSLGYSRG